MRGLSVVWLTLFLSIAMTAFANDDQLKKNKNYPLKKRDKLLEYKNDIPQHGNYYEWDGKKWQRYEGNIPQVGYYLKKIERVDNDEKKQAK